VGSNPTLSATRLRFGGLVRLTVPIFLPVIVGAGFDPIWFGIPLIALCET
jgi:TRAP-type C4-dicarboxylate transport system permease large subunit